MADAAAGQRGASLTRRVIEMIALAAALGLAFLIVNYIHFQLVTVSVILFACAWDGAIASALVLGGYLLLRRRAPILLPTEFALIAIASNLLILLYAVMGPTVIDRSLSIYIVQKIDQRGGEIAQASLEDIFVEEYMPEFSLVDVRLTEQLSSQTVIIEDGCVILTKKGKLLSRFADRYRKALLPQKRRLLNRETDALTDPFRNAPQKVDIACPGRAAAPSDGTVLR